jgi:glycosyltransferase involved in cell wall biosynthesis
MTLIALDVRSAFVGMPHGSGIYVRRLLEALRAGAGSGHELLAFTHARRGPEVLWEQLRLPALLRARRAGLVHSPDTFLPLRRPCPGVVTIHDLAFLAIPGDMTGSTGAKYRLLAPWSARSAERVICPSRFTADDLVRRCGVKEERIRVIPEAPALPLGSDAAGAGDPATPYLLAAGDLRPKKNLPRLIEAWRSLRAEGLPHRLVLAGADLGLGGRLRSLAAGEPLELTGFVADDALDRLIRRADALVLPGTYEGFGLIALDAMARGCPAVLARAGALPETGGDAAVYFEAEDRASLAGAIRRALAERERLRAAGLRHAAGFSWERTAALTVAVYEELL